MTLKINQNFKSIINNQLINSHKLSYTFQIFNNKLLINRFDYEEVEGIRFMWRNAHDAKVAVLVWSASFALGIQPLLMVSGYILCHDC